MANRQVCMYLARGCVCIHVFDVHHQMEVYGVMMVMMEMMRVEMMTMEIVMMEVMTMMIMMMVMVVMMIKMMVVVMMMLMLKMGVMMMMMVMMMMVVHVDLEDGVWCIMSGCVVSPIVAAQLPLPGEWHFDGLL